MKVSAPLLIDLTGHLAISIAVGEVVYSSYRSHQGRVLFISFLCLFIDVDHFSPFRDFTGGVNLFHNLTFALVIPLLSAIIFYLLGRRRHSYSGVYTSLLFLVILMGHVVYDGIDTTPVTLYYPLSERTMNFQEVFAFLPFEGNALSIVAVLFYAALVFSFSYLLKLMKKDEVLYADYLKIKGEENNKKGFLDREKNPIIFEL